MSESHLGADSSHVDYVPALPAGLIVGFMKPDSSRLPPVARACPSCGARTCLRTAANVYRLRCCAPGCGWEGEENRVSQPRRRS
jgi:hypothetical protein